MTPVDQMSLDRQTGDCLSAAVASLLSVPLDEVPAFVADHVAHDGDTDHEWHWWSVLNRWLRDHGYALGVCSESDPELAPAVGEHYLALGNTVRGTFHAVVHVDGRLAHDPHPSRAGLSDTTHTYTIRWLP